MTILKLTTDALEGAGYQVRFSLIEDYYEWVMNGDWQVIPAVEHGHTHVKELQARGISQEPFEPFPSIGSHGE